MLIRYKDKKHSEFVNVKMGDCIRYKDELFIKIGDAKTLKYDSLYNCCIGRLFPFIGFPLTTHPRSWYNKRSEKERW